MIISRRKQMDEPCLFMATVCFAKEVVCGYSYHIKELRKTCTENWWLTITILCPEFDLSYQTYFEDIGSV